MSHSQSEPPPSPEPVWTYRGYQLKASEFTTAMVHLFRAEIQRANVWRQRLDTTTNWAVVTTGAAISFAFTQAQPNHIVILLDMLLVTMFLIMEARRYRYYELWASRVRLMETDFFAAMLVPPFHPAADWAESLADNLLTPHFPISLLEAIGRRLRRNYLWIYAVVGLAWLANLWLMPAAVTSLAELSKHAAVGSLPGELVLFGVALFYISLSLIAALTITMQKASGEVLPRFHRDEGAEAKASFLGAWYRPKTQRQQLLTLVITDKPEAVSAQILQVMRRGTTILDSRGAYTGKANAVLMIALTATEIPQLKAIVAQTDPNAFVIVSPAQNIFGKGFVPLNPEKE